jgi:hypothetical protein
VTETARTNSPSYATPSYTSYTASQASSPNYNNYYNVQTLNYHKLNNEPFSNRIEISTGKTNEVVTYGSSNTTPADPATNIPAYNYTSPPKVEIKSTRTLVNNTGINLDEYERIERDGRVVYKKKIQVEVKPNVDSSAYSN